MEYLQDGLAKLQSLYSFCKKISIIGSAKFAGSHRTLMLEKMVEKILLHDNSILLLTSVAQKQIQELDISLIASATRNIMDSTNIYFHIAQRGLSKNDVEFRSFTMSLNATYNENNITEKFGFSQDCYHAQIDRFFYKQSNVIFQRFTQFNELPKDEQKKVLSGHKPTYNMKSPNILEKQTESAIYNLLSNSVHGLYLGLSNNSINRSYPFNSFFNATRLLTISLQVSRIYTAHVVKDYLNLRKRLYSLLTAEEKTQLKLYMCSTDLKNYIEMLRVEYEKDLWGK